MATSGTIGQTTISVARLIDNAMRRSGVSPAQATPDTYLAARDSLFFFLVSLTNTGVNLWCINRVICGMKNAQYQYALPAGTFDIQTVLYRQNVLPDGGTPGASTGTAANAFDLDLLTACTQSAPNGNISYIFADPKVVTNVGVISNGAATYSLIYEYSLDGLTWNTLLETETQVYADNTWVCFEVTNTVEAAYYRVRETGGATLNIREVVFNNVQNEYVIGKINLDEYSALPNKNQVGSPPAQYYFDRQLTNPTLWVWPVPGYDFDQLSVWVQNQIQDVGSLSNDVAVPTRWMDALQTGLAARLCLEIPGADVQRQPVLKALADEAFTLAAMQETDMAPVNIMPNFSCYTR